LDPGGEICDPFRAETEPKGSPVRETGAQKDRLMAEGARETDRSTDVDALGEIMLLQGTMQRQFLRILLRRIASDVPSFNAELFLAELDLLREGLEAGRDRTALHGFALKEWERLSEMALDAIASTRARAGAH
jgi:hypothetical protein